MKETAFTQAVKEVMEVKLKAIDEYIENIIEPIANIGNPEKLVGAPYKEWKDNQFILQKLSEIYGKQEPNPLSELIYRKTIEEVRELEGEE